jgi:hypothetical protein
MSTELQKRRIEAVGKFRSTSDSLYSVDYLKVSPASQLETSLRIQTYDNPLCSSNKNDCPINTPFSTPRPWTSFRGGE